MCGLILQPELAVYCQGCHSLLWCLYLPLTLPGSQGWVWNCFLLFCCLGFSVVFCQPAISFLIPNAFPLFLSSEYSISYVCWLFSFMESKQWLILMWHLAHLSYSLYYVEVNSSYFVQSFYHEGILNSVKGFYCIYWDNLIIWFFILFKCCIMFIDLCMLTLSCIPSMKPTWSLCVFFLRCYWIWFENILMRNFCI
jgi:hypothetical protein